MFKKALLDLTKRLYPKGLAFRIPIDGVLENLHKGLAISENKFHEDVVGILDSILPDNDNFTEEDATDWERRLGLITNPLLDLSIRKTALLRKMNHPGTIKARGHYLYIQQSLQAAGFNVYVHENRFFELGDYTTKTPDEVAGAGVVGSAIHRTSLQHGQVNHGGGFRDKIVNSIDKNIDKLFDIGDNYRSTFFIGGETLGTFATIVSSREVEFRQLVLRLKPAQMVAFPFINILDPDYNDDFNSDFNI